MKSGPGENMQPVFIKLLMQTTIKCVADITIFGKTSTQKIWKLSQVNPSKLNFYSYAPKFMPTCLKISKFTELNSMQGASPAQGAKKYLCVQGEHASELLNG